MVSRWVTEKNKWLNVSSSKRWLPWLTLDLFCICRDNPQSVEQTAKPTFVEVWQADPSHRVKQSQLDLPSDAPWSSSPGHTAHSSSTTPWRMALSCTMKSGTSLLPLTSDDHLVFDLITTESINISAHSLYISTSECGLDRRKRKYNDLPACDRTHTIRATLVM